jgi:hypothetical protein
LDQYADAVTSFVYEGPNAPRNARAGSGVADGDRHRDCPS